MQGRWEEPSPSHLLCAYELSGSLSHIYYTCAHEPEHVHTYLDTLPSLTPRPSSTGFQAYMSFMASCSHSD